MCTCASCKATDTLRGRPFIDWPKGERSPTTVYGRDKVPVDKAYKAHWNHCGAEALRARDKLDLRMHLPKGGTVQTDPRIRYSFPGGQAAQYRHDGGKLYPIRDAYIPATDDVTEYVRLFCESNNLIQ